MNKEIHKKIDWSKQHCGVHQASRSQLFELMPDLQNMISKTFPDAADNFVWDVKVHMLMPGQFPCIPNWHYDNIPRVNNQQDFSLANFDLPMYLWLSGPPLTVFRKGGIEKPVDPGTWHKFSQSDQHRGVMSESFCWRGFIRATHKDIYMANRVNKNPLRRHSQVYLDASDFSW